MSPELDTYSITKRVKEVLTDNNLGTGYRESGMLPLALFRSPLPSGKSHGEIPGTEVPSAGAAQPWATQGPLGGT